MLLRGLINSPAIIKGASNILQTSILLSQQIRTTFILKRRWEPPLSKKNYPPRKLRGRHFVFDLVEDTLLKPQKNLEVVLTQFVDGVGQKGDVVSLRSHFAYTKLLLPGLAVYKTDENILKYAKTDNDNAEDLHSSPYALRTVNKLERLVLAVVMNKDNPWVIEPWHIRASLRKAGYHCEDSCVELPEKPIEGPDLNKENKEFFVTITINNLEKARVKCRIHHWSTDPSERLPYAVDPWKHPAEPLFSE